MEHAVDDHGGHDERTQDAELIAAQHDAHTRLVRLLQESGVSGTDIRACLTAPSTAAEPVSPSPDFTLIGEVVQGLVDDDFDNLDGAIVSLCVGIPYERVQAAWNVVLQVLGLSYRLLSQARPGVSDGIPLARANLGTPSQGYYSDHDE